MSGESENVYNNSSLSGSDKVHRTLRPTRSTILGTRPSRTKTQEIYRPGDRNETQIHPDGRPKTLARLDYRPVVLTETNPTQYPT